MSRDIVPFGLRMPPELKKRVEDAARASGRSLNAEICQRLEQSFASESTSESPNLVDEVEELRRRVEALERTLGRREKP